jgi:hypothetical protein
MHILSADSLPGDQILLTITGILADVLERNILVPGHQIWAAWSSLSALDPILTAKQVSNLQLLPGIKSFTSRIFC